ncbi:hypothetical protein ACTA71_008512 [Dictyostelium dimigraforme]
MKLNLFLVLFIFTIGFVIINGAVVNYTPITSSTCSKTAPYGGGVGYSIHVGDCFTIDGSASFQITEKNGNYTVTAYAISKQGTAQCEGRPKFSEQIIEGCGGSPLFNNNFEVLVGSTMIVSINKEVNRDPSIDDLPSTVSSYINSYSFFGCGVPFAIEYFISGTPVTDGYYETVYMCDNVTPMVMKCLNPQDSSVEQPNSSSASSSLEGLNCTEPYAYQPICFELAELIYLQSYCYDPTIQ